MHLTAHAADNETLNNKAARIDPRVATAHGSYGAGCGPLAYKSVLSFAQGLGNGRRPLMIQTGIPEKIESQVRKAKAEGCVALIVEMVRAADGSVLSQDAWRHLLNACKGHCLVLIVDEALTAIRCGAPFAYQLPQYRKFGWPDLFFPGKRLEQMALRLNGRASTCGSLALSMKELVNLFASIGKNVSPSQRQRRTF